MTHSHPSARSCARPTRLALRLLVASTPFVLPIATAQDDGVDRVMLDLTPLRTRIGLLEVNTDSIVYTEASGLVRTARLSDLAAVYAQKPAPPLDPSAAWIELTDGQRFIGQLAPVGENAEDVGWESPIFGLLHSPLDLVHAIVLDQSAARPTGPRNDDMLVLRNGDVLTGFIEHIGPLAEIDTGDRPVRIPIDRGAVAIFANQPRDRAGLFVWLADGTTARVASLRTNGSLVELARKPAHPDTEANAVAPPRHVPMSELLAVVADAAVITPLASITPDAQRPSPDRRWTPPARFGSPLGQPLDAATIEMPGPMRIEWLLPPGTRSLIFDALLPDYSRTWGDCEIVVAAHASGLEHELARVRLFDLQPSATVVARFPPDAVRVSITLEPGRFGPAQDRALLLGALLLVEP